ncbi:MAG: hypothetical protein U0575_07990 [Phycisphaerales bacterium]
MRTTLVALAATAVGVVVCFLLVDEPVANFVARHPIDRHACAEGDHDDAADPSGVDAGDPRRRARVARCAARPAASRWERTIAGACLDFLLVADQRRVAQVRLRSGMAEDVDRRQSLACRQRRLRIQLVPRRRGVRLLPIGHMAITVGFFSVL